MITLIISGGQTGADQAGLRAAHFLGINTGGTAPKGYRTESGPLPELGTLYRLDEDENTYDYEPRTRKNVAFADATVIFGVRSAGSNLTERVCRELDKPCLWITTFHMASQRIRFRLWLARTRPEILNVAGNRESRNQGIGSAVERFLVSAISEGGGL